MQDEDATVPAGKHFSRAISVDSPAGAPSGFREDFVSGESSAQEEASREDARPEDDAAEVASGEAAQRVLRYEDVQHTRVLDPEDKAPAQTKDVPEGTTRERDVDSGTSRDEPQARRVFQDSSDEKTRLIRERPHAASRDTPRGTVTPPSSESKPHAADEKTRLRDIPRASSMDGTHAAQGGNATREDTARDERSATQRRRYAAEGMRWKVRTTLRRMVNRLVGPNIDDADEGGRDHGDYRPQGAYPRRSFQWPERLAMPKLAGLIGGAVCLFLVLSPWLSATAVAGSGGLASIATLGPRGIMANTWDIISRTYGGVAVSRALSAFMEELAAELAGTATGSILPAFVLLVLGTARIVALVLLVIGLLLALFDSSRTRFSTLYHGITWTLWASLAWVVVLPRLGWGVGSVSVSSSTGNSIASWGEGLVMGYSAGRYAWIALVVSLVTLLVIRAWRRNHFDYWG